MFLLTEPISYQQSMPCSHPHIADLTKADSIQFNSILLFRKYSNIQFFTFTIFKVINDDYIITIQRMQN